MDQEENLESISEENKECDEEDLAQNADDKVDALINLLIKKGLITEEEFDKELDDLYEE